LVRRREHAHVGAERFAPADALERALLEEAEELGLVARREIADFVEKERTGVGELDAALDPSIGARERISRALAIAPSASLHQNGADAIRFGAAAIS
jgi:hypothetical protein